MKMADRSVFKVTLIRSEASPAVFQQSGVNPGLLIQQLPCILLPPVLPLGFVHLLRKHQRLLMFTRIYSIFYVLYKNTAGKHRKLLVLTVVERIKILLLLC